MIILEAVSRKDKVSINKLSQNIDWAELAVARLILMKIIYGRFRGTDRLNGAGWEEVLGREGTTHNVMTDIR